ncbi:hypothetical protein TSUD_240330 [Trifolium subterraneum]|uniref:NAC domain-containing protein n=1 Tax=Trifolium subterraneum TaxID=3900 RepID=A0A2Z6PF20_TRISU|nr:hypothetical protein TSUD_240330 [Trifolium subterraneum]
MQESWAICRIFKKTNSTAQRALSQSWVSSFSETRTSNMLTKNQEITQFCSDNNMSLTKKTTLANNFCTNNNHNQNFHVDVNPLLHKAFDHLLPISSNEDFNTSMIFSSSPSSQLQTSNNNNIISKSTIDVSSMLLNMSSSMFGDFNKTCDNEVTTTNLMNGGLQEQFSEYSLPYGNYQYENNNNNNALVKVPYNVNVNLPRIDDEQELMHFNIGDAWKSNLLWDTSFCPCDVPSSYYSTTTKCYT